MAAAGIGAHVLSIMSVASIVCLLISGIILLNLIQKAFDRDGVLWGLISVLYPIGTYFYCRKNWELYRGSFVLITGLVVTYFALWLIVKLA